MRGFMNLALVASATLLSQALALPNLHKRSTVVQPGSASDIVITKDNTLNATSNQPASGNGANANAQLELTFTNNFAGAVNAYLTGLDSNGALVFLQPDGTFFYPMANSDPTLPPAEITADIAIPLGAQGQNSTITLPDYVSSGRIYFAIGTLHFYTVMDGNGKTALVQPSVTPTDPNAATHWGFVEFTNNDTGIYANVSYVDFVGLPLGMVLTTSDGPTQTTVGLNSGIIPTLCSALNAAASDGAPWGSLCQTDSSGNPLRVVAPIDYISQPGNADAFGDYWTAYIDQVYTTYSTSTLTVDTQEGDGQVACTVSDDVMSCAGSDTTYPKPAVADIFGCSSGTFANPAGTSSVNQAAVPRLCAAFNRGTLLLNGGNLQPSLPSTSYYTSEPYNVYSAIVHQQEVDGKGYAFSYDDVNPTGENASGTLADQVSPWSFPHSHMTHVEIVSNACFCRTRSVSKSLLVAHLCRNFIKGVGLGRVFQGGDPFDGIGDEAISIL